MPFWCFSVAIGLVGILFGWLAIRAFPWLRRGWTAHVYWPTVIAYRMVYGKPLWRPEDLMIGQQPRTEVDRQIAREHEHVGIMECGCGDPDCALKDNPQFTWMPGAKAMREQAERQGAPVIDLDAMPPVIKQKFLEAARKIVGYDEVADENTKLRQLVEVQQKQLLSYDQVLESDKQLIESDKRVIEADAKVITQLQDMVKMQEIELERRDRDLDELRSKYAEMERTVDGFRATHLAN